jgi:O-antigen ligase
MVNHTDKDWRQHLIFYSMIIMLAGLFTSRVLLSAGTILFLVFTCIHRDFFRQLKLFARQPFLLGMAFLFFIPLVTWFWSEDKEMWWRFIRIKLPLVLLPLGFAGNWTLFPQQWKWLAYIFLALAFGGCCWSLWQYAINSDVINSGYLKAKVMPTPFENDHVRYSLVVCIAVLCALMLALRETKMAVKTVLTFLSVFFIIYLHILSARTGLLSLYLLLLSGLTYLLFRYRKTKLSLYLMVIAVAMPLLAWFTLPTFQNRIRYVLYDFSFIQKEQYLPGANDGNRMLSLRAGWDVFMENPWGVGSGDIVSAANQWYSEHVPGMLATDKLFPASEWLMYAGAAGWIGLAGFTIIMAVPFFQKTKGPFFWTGLNMVIAFSLLFDIGLEVQFGVFIYSFFLLWWWKWLTTEKMN